MGTTFEILVHPRHADVAELALEEIRYWHRRLTRFEPDSLVSHINRTAAAQPVRVDAATFALLRDALAVCRASGGAFDITLGRGADAVVLDEGEGTVALADADVAIDLGGIAKGHALDVAAAVLREHAVTHALLHGGTSSVVTIGDSCWRVALGPAGRRVLELRACALGVSSNHERAHVIGADRSHVAAVVGPSARLADAWSTALLVLGSRPAALTRDWTTYLEAA